MAKRSWHRCRIILPGQPLVVHATFHAQKGCRNDLVIGKMAMTREDDPIQVQIGLRTHPLRDGGGKPFMGRCSPRRRDHSPLASLETDLKLTMDSLTPLVMKSLEAPSRDHTFPHEAPRHIRNVLGQATGTDTHLVEYIPPGQPFHLDLISAKERVPLGVTDPILVSPGIWPSKEELSGEEYDPQDFPDLLGRDNYPSAKDFSEKILKTFAEEKLLDMVTGPHSMEEASQLCGCTFNF